MWSYSSYSECSNFDDRIFLSKKRVKGCNNILYYPQTHILSSFQIFSSSTIICSTPYSPSSIHVENQISKWCASSFSLKIMCSFYFNSFTNLPNILTTWFITATHMFLDSSFSLPHPHAPTPLVLLCQWEYDIVSLDSYWFMFFCMNPWSCYTSK